jgi:hypothetical protein
MRYMSILFVLFSTHSFAFGQLIPISTAPVLKKHYTVTGTLDQQGFDCSALYSHEAELQLKEYWYLKRNNRYEIPPHQLKLKNGTLLQQGKVLANTPVTPYDEDFSLQWSEPFNINKNPWVFDVYQVSEHEVIGPTQQGMQASPAYRVLVLKLHINETTLYSTTFEPWVFFQGNETDKHIGALSLQCVQIFHGK